MMSLLWARARVERLLFRHSGRAVQAITGKYCTVQDCTAARLLRDGQEKRFDHCVQVLRRAVPRVCKACTAATGEPRGACAIRAQARRLRNGSLYKSFPLLERFPFS
jgi:hypothetical protein